MSAERIKHYPPLVKGVGGFVPKKDGLITNYREIPYNPKNKIKARYLRNNATRGEIIFWSELLKNRKSGFQFYRQKSILHYIADFYSAKLKLVIELDGSSHNNKQEYDSNRDKDLLNWGIKTIRYKESSIINDFESIKTDFEFQIKQRIKELKVTEEIIK